eukprot:CAMPEP_0175184380 /NCGR_PEP_ID=MMETSP0093-20121207/1335_1 /TAXON_ID=311494 /ORGANISM="Alexandrium monilatum, Strain CCMP3105" /LENGTH=74 /DNA_ID=CAMNT_0016477047 /DNA_START=27 /DNA_END=248 /DNA_ORIENTATION=-
MTATGRGYLSNPVLSQEAEPHQACILADERLRRTQHLKRACELFREEAGLIVQAESESRRSAEEGSVVDNAGVS